MAFSFLTWIIRGFSLLTLGLPLIELLVMIYTGILLFLAIRAQNRSHNVWQKSVREEAIFHPEAKSGGTPAQVPTITASLPQTYPPAPAPTPGAIQV